MLDAIAMGERLEGYFANVGEDIVAGMQIIADAPDDPSKSHEVRAAQRGGRQGAGMEERRRSIRRNKGEKR